MIMFIMDIMCMCIISITIAIIFISISRRAADFHERGDGWTFVLVLGNGVNQGLNISYCSL